jgi:hypothetical protein
MKKVHSTTTRTGMSVRWVPVTADDGRVRMEMRWSAVPVVPSHSA